MDETADLKLTARRIVFGKYLNCGQTCVAPDYLLCQESVKDALLEEIVRQITVQFGPAPLDSPSYGKIVNQKHFQRLLGLIQPEKVVCGGTWQEEALRIAPTVMDAVTWQDPVMGEEIFGPILPVLTFSHIPEVLELLKDRPKPLALYLFSRNKGHIRAVTERDVYKRQKYENRANKWAYKKLVPQDELAEACLQGYREPWELAEYFGVTEDFLRGALKYYQERDYIVT